MNFVQNILQRLTQTPERPVLQEVRAGQIQSATCAEFLGLVKSARAFLRNAGVKQGDRCALLAHNSIRWAAMDLAMMAEGILVVPLYPRQAALELVGMMKDCGPSRICCGDRPLADAIAEQWPEAPRIHLFEEIFDSGAGTSGIEETPISLADDDPVTIIYTSGTSGEPKGVVLNVGNLNHMLGCTNSRLDLLMGPREAPDQVFHYLPFCFAGS